MKLLQLTFSIMRDHIRAAVRRRKVAMAIVFFSLEFLLVYRTGFALKVVPVSLVISAVFTCLFLFVLPAGLFVAICGWSARDKGQTLADYVRSEAYELELEENTSDRL